MMNTLSTMSSALLQLLVLPTPLVAPPSGQEPEVSLTAGPAADVALIYSFVHRLSIRLERAGYADGTVPPEYEGLRRETEFREEIHFRDEILRQDATAADVLEMCRTVLRARRTFHDEGYGLDPGSWTKSCESASLLEQRKLLFTRSDVKSDFSLSIAPSEESAQEVEPEAALLLEDDIAPRLDLGFSALLPDGPVSVGESWTPSAADFSWVLRPGGELGFRTIRTGREGEEVEEGLRDGRFAQKEPDGGDLTCTLKALDVQGGNRLATIEIKGKLESRTPKTFEVDKDAVQGDAGIFDLNVERWETTEWSVEGKVVWDVDGGHPAELELSGLIEIRAYMEGRSADRSTDTGPPDVDLRWRTVGTLAVEVEVHRAPEGAQGKTTAEEDR